MTNEIDEIRNGIANELKDDFTSEQLREIDLAIAKILPSYNIQQSFDAPVPINKYRPYIIQEFIARKKIKGLSDKTIDRYEYVLYHFAAWATKDLTEMTDLDILIYLDYLSTNHDLSKRSLDWIRVILSSFYSYLHESGKMSYNPLKTIDPIKYKSKVREPLTDIEMEQIRDACRNPKERAIIEVLYSTGGRVSEIINMNISDIDMDKRRAIITGKGDKERYVFFNGKSIYTMKKYLETRTDDNPALFVKDRAPYSRITIAGIEWIIKHIGERAGLTRPLFPHLFRHTFATDMLSNGAPIDEVSRILGHEKIETTRIYAKSSADMLQLSHKMHIA